jgi:polyphosphate kinase 2 (PPK2 family)
VAFEHDLARRPVRVAKAFIHIGRGEQLARLEAREANLDLRHLHNERDFADQGDWHELMAAFGLVMTMTHTEESPWLVIPGDDRATRNAVVAALLVELLSP